MKKHGGWKRVSAIGAGAMLALSLTFGLVFSDLSVSGNETSVDNDLSQNITGGALIVAKK